MADYRRQAEYLTRTLLLPTPPVAVKYLRELSEDDEWDLADKGFHRPKTPLNACQFVGLARHHQRKTLAKPEDHVCNIGALATGAQAFDEDMSRGEIAKKDGIRVSDDLCAAMFQTLPRIPEGKVVAMLFSPLDKMDLEADQVVLYGSPLQMLKALTGYLYDHAARAEFTTCAKYGVCVEGLAAAYVSGKPALGFPCRGERVSSIVQDHEVYLVVPAAELDRMIAGIEKTKHLLPLPLPFGGVDQEPNFLPDYYLTPATLKRRV
jgi:uncharacterized protein (DUF169 family)